MVYLLRTSDECQPRLLKRRYLNPCSARPLACSVAVR